MQEACSTISSCLTRGFQYQGSERGLPTCFPDTDLTTAKNLMEARGIKQLPVVKRGVGHKTERRRKLVALLYYDSIGHCLRLVISFHCFLFCSRLYILSQQLYFSWSFTLSKHAICSKIFEVLGLS